MTPFSGPEPTQLGIVREASQKAAGPSDDLVNRFPDDEGLQRPDRLDDHFVAAPDRERESVAFMIAVGSQDHVGGRVVGILVDGVGARVDE